MKTSTILKQINDSYNKGNINFEEFISTLHESCEHIIKKERIILIKKFSKIFNIPVEKVENKILPKKKRHIIEEILANYAISSSKIILYKNIIINNRTFICEMQQYGLVYELDKNEIVNIVGIMYNNRPRLLKVFLK